MRKTELQVAIVGAGSLGSALTLALRDAGVHISEVVQREEPLKASTRKLARIVGATPARLPDALFNAQVTWLCVNDAAISEVAAEMSAHGDWLGKVVFHSSGALTSDELIPLQRAGAHTASVHPMMSFVRGVKPNLAGVTFAIQGDEPAVKVAIQIVRRLRGRIVQIEKKNKPLYHAWGAFASPLIVAELSAADRIASALGLDSETARKTIAPILRQTIENYIEHGAAGAFSGPIVRGDVDTVRRHLSVLKKIPVAEDVYRALAEAALRELPAGNRSELKRILTKPEHGKGEALGSKNKDRMSS